jgi:biotin synthase
MKKLFSQAEYLYNQAIQCAVSDADLDMVINWPEESLPVLWGCTDSVRRHFFNDTVSPCAIMNVKSGGCTEDCAFCAQSRHHETGVPVRPLASADEIVKACAAAREKDLDFCVVSSGRRLSRADVGAVAEAVRRCGGGLHASLGILSERDFLVLRDAGVVCYNHNLETSRRFFPHIVSTHKWDERVETVRAAKNAGMKVCSGGVFGIGENWQDRKSLCCTLRDLDVDIIPLNFFNPVEGTRLTAPVESPMEFLKIVSLFRMAFPARMIKVCGGREYHLKRLTPLMFFAGANGYISGGYLTTAGDGVESDDNLIKALSLEKVRD